MFSEKAQISFDFILTIMIFLLVLGFVLSFADDFSINSSQMKNNLETYNFYLKTDDAVLSSLYFEGYSEELNSDSNITDCFFNADPASKKIYIFSIDKNYEINGFNGTSLNHAQCGTGFKVVR